MKTIIIVAVALVAYVQAITFSDGTSIYVPGSDRLYKYNSALSSVVSIAIPAAQQISTAFDGVVDRSNTFLHIFTGSGSTYQIVKINLADFTYSQTRPLDRKPVDKSAFADSSFIYWMDNAPNSNTTWVRVAASDITGTSALITLLGQSTPVQARPDPRAGFDSTRDLVMYFVGPAGFLQRASTNTFTVINPIPIPTTQNVIHVQNGLAYDLSSNGAEQTIRSYTFETTALNATTGSSAVPTNTAGQLVSPLLEDRYNRGFFHTVVYTATGDKSYIRYVDRTLVRSNANAYVLTNSAASNALPRVDASVLHYSAGNRVYAYNVADGTSRSSLIGGTSNAANALSSALSFTVAVVFLAYYLM